MTEHPIWNRMKGFDWGGDQWRKCRLSDAASWCGFPNRWVAGEWCPPTGPHSCMAKMGGTVIERDNLERRFFSFQREIYFFSDPFCHLKYDSWRNNACFFSLFEDQICINMCGFYTTPGNSRIPYIKGNFADNFLSQRWDIFVPWRGNESRSVGLPGSFAQTQRSSKGSMPEAKWLKFEGENIQKNSSLAAV